MTETKPKRRWFRFSLRTLLVLLTLACVLLSVFAIWHRSQLIEHHRQQDAADRIIAKKGHVSWMSWVRRAGEQNGKVPESLMRAADQSNAFLRLCGVDLRNSPDADGVAIATEVADLSQLDAFTFPVKWLDDPILIAIGSVMVVLPFNFRSWSLQHGLLSSIIIIASGIPIGAGFALPFKQTRLGILIGPVALLLIGRAIGRMLGP